MNATHRVRNRFHLEYKAVERSMTGLRTLTVAAAVAFTLSSGAALAQMPNSPAAPSGVIVNPARTLPSSPDDVPSPMQEQAMVPNMAPISTVCGPQSSAKMKDEFGRIYNCRGDRVR